MDPAVRLGLAGAPTTAEERLEKAKEMKEEVEKRTTRVHGDALPVLFGSPGLSELPRVIGTMCPSLEPVASQHGPKGDRSSLSYWLITSGG